MGKPSRVMESSHSNGRRTSRSSSATTTGRKNTGNNAGGGYSMESFHEFRQKVGELVNDSKVQAVIVALIAINAIMMGIATFDLVDNDKELSEIFETVDTVFLCIFTVELALQFFYHGFHLFLDGWLIFDFVIILVSWMFSSVQIIRAFRIFRALRLVTRIKVMKNLVAALFEVMPRMAAISLLMMLIFYIFAVMFTQLFRTMYANGETDVDYFSRLDSTLFTLFQIMTLDAWADIARDVMDTHKWAWLPFIVFVVISGFIVVNLFIAVICDAVGALHDDDKAKLHGFGPDQDEDSEDENQTGGRTDPVQRRLFELEAQVKELTQIQDQTLAALEGLTYQVRQRRLRNLALNQNFDSPVAANNNVASGVQSSPIENHETHVYTRAELDTVFPSPTSYDAKSCEMNHQNYVSTNGPGENESIAH